MHNSVVTLLSAFLSSIATNTCQKQCCQKNKDSLQNISYKPSNEYNFFKLIVANRFFYQKLVRDLVPVKLHILTTRQWLIQLLTCFWPRNFYYLLIIIHGLFPFYLETLLQFWNGNTDSEYKSFT